MTNREIKQLFYKFCSSYIYVPSIFEDEIWDYHMSTVGNYVGTDLIWNDFCDVVNNTYGGDVDAMEKDIYNLSMDVISYITTSFKDKQFNNEILNIDKSIGFCNIKNGYYLTFDLKNCHMQTMLYYNVVTKDKLDEIFSKYENGDVLKNRKWVLRFICNNCGVKLYVKKMIDDAIAENDPILSLFSEKYILIGDRMFIPIYEKDIEKYQNILYKDYTTVNGLTFFVDVCEKKSVRNNVIPDVYVDNSKNSTKKFYRDINNTTLEVSYDMYPQLYKKHSKKPIEDYDIVYGYDDEYLKFTIRL